MNLSARLRVTSLRGFNGRLMQACFFVERLSTKSGSLVHLKFGSVDRPFENNFSRHSTVRINHEEFNRERRRIWRRHFATTRPQMLHPVIWYLVRPVAKFTAIIVGRGVRKWWHSLPKDKKVVLFDALQRNKIQLTVIAIVLMLASAAYYESHVQETPLTGRRRFIAFTESQIQELAEFLFEMMNADVADRLLPASHSDYRRIEALAKRLVQANQDLRQIRDRQWSVSVIDDPIANAFVLPNGKIFVYTGMLKECDNDDQMGVILGHEMAHAVLGHGGETVSYTHLLEMITIAFVAAVWAILPADYISALVHWLSTKFVNIFLHLPLSRVLETEADEIGLMMSAKACFDVRESVTFWTKMQTQEKQSGVKSSEWLSTHPNHDARSVALERKLPNMLLLRERCNCPILPRRQTAPSSPPSSLTSKTVPKSSVTGTVVERTARSTR